MQDARVVLILFTCIIGASIIGTWAWWRFIGRGMAKEKQRRDRLALLLNPVYRAKVEEDRRYQLAWANLSLQRERLYLVLQL